MESAWFQMKDILNTYNLNKIYVLVGVIQYENHGFEKNV